MATIHVVLATVRARSLTQSSLPVPDSAVAGVATLTSSGTSAAASLTGAKGNVWVVTASGGKVWVKFGAGTPVAVSGDGWLVLDGQTRAFAVTTVGEKIAIKDA